LFKKTIAVLALICGFFATAAAADKELEKLLTNRYRDRVFALRHPFQSNSQEYDAAGTPLKTSDEGAWTLYGRIVVKKVFIDADALRIEGNRVVFKFDDREKRLMPFATLEHVKITIRLNGFLTSSDEADGVLNRVFAITDEDIVKSAPPSWQSYLATEMAATQGANKGATQSGGVAQVPPSGGTGKLLNLEGQKVINLPPGVFGEDDTVDGEKVFHFGPGVTAPRILYQPEPEFTDAARKAAFQGKLGMTFIVDRTGRVKNVRLIHPLGMGLDENAINTVSTWRFSPATRDGQPVAFALYVEVNFHLGL
jgi:TonB family protein